MALRIVRVVRRSKLSALRQALGAVHGSLKAKSQWPEFTGLEWTEGDATAFAGGGSPYPSARKGDLDLAVADAHGVIAQPAHARQRSSLGLEICWFGLRTGTCGRPRGVVVAVRVKPARGRELDDVTRLKVERATVQRTPNHADLQRPDRQGRGHVRAAIVSRADSGRRVDEQQVYVGPRHAQHSTDGQIRKSGDADEGRIARTGGL